MTEFPKALRALRRRYFSKQLVLANECQCSTAHISWLESGKRCPSCAMLLKLRKALANAHASKSEVVDLMERARSDMIKERFDGVI
jgi:predicted transcriptional regulator